MADYVEETTTSIAGTSGDGAVTLTAITNTPRLSTVFGTQATHLRYVIEDTVNKKFEMGLGSVAGNVLTRTKPQLTWDGAAYAFNAPSQLQFGSTPTAGNIKVRMAPLAESQGVVVHAKQTVIAGDATWRDYPVSSTINVGSTGSTGTTLTADRENYALYRNEIAGLLTGMQFEVGTAVASSNLKVALYAVGPDGLPGAKICDFVTTSTATSGIKTDTAVASWTPAGPVWLTPGWYYIGFIASHAISIRTSSSGTTTGFVSPIGRHGGYGMGTGVWVAGSYATGLPATPSLGSGTMYSARADNPGSPWIGLKVLP